MSVEYSLSKDEKTLTATITLDTEGRTSKSGKSQIHASSGGFERIAGTDMRVSYNVISDAS